MKLIDFRVRQFRSVRDSGDVRVSDVTCLVGKNEAGKTALLKALNCLNPIDGFNAEFSVTDDYPRVDVSDYEEAVEKGQNHDIPITAVYELTDNEATAVAQVFGPDFLTSKLVEVSRSYGNKRDVIVRGDERAAISFLSRTFPSDIQKEVSKAENASEFHEALQPFADDPAVALIMPLIQEAIDDGFCITTWERVLEKHEPKFMYFDEYFQLTGCENIESLRQRVEGSSLKPSDMPLLGLIELAGLKLDQLTVVSRTQELKNRLEGAGARLTQRILPFWSQNRHLRMNFDVRPAAPNDPPEMRTGTNIWGEVLDTKHFASTPLGSRSRGFVWFFSFVAWYSQVQRNQSNVIILLDEPGLTLHGKAQADLLRYFEEVLKPNHQIIFTTHSPFMIDPQHFGRVRIVQDLSIEKDDVPKKDQGTKVTEDLFEASDDSIFPLQGALGYEIHQTLFVGPNSLLIEGASDFLYIQAISSVLSREGREGISDRWTLTPVGGASRVPTFVRFLTNQRNLNIATLIDIQMSDKPLIEKIYKDKLLKKGNVLTFADFTGTEEADIEDMFEADLYLKVVNDEFGVVLQEPIETNDFASKSPRILQRIEHHLQAKPLKKGKFSHYRPARRFTEELTAYAPLLSDATKDRFERAFVRLNALLPK